MYPTVKTSLKLKFLINSTRYTKKIIKKVKLFCGEGYV